MSKTITRIGLEDNGRRMTLEEFEFSERDEGYVYELSRGVVIVNEVPANKHFLQVNEIRKQISAYEAAHPDVIFSLASGNDCKILLESLQSERHPDWAIYKARLPLEEDVWSTWIPEIVIEVVTPSSKDRDYVQKREEYLAFGVQEYWIFDADKREMLGLKRSRGRWAEQIVRPPDVYRTHLLKGLDFRCTGVFEAADQAAE
jgi:Uma2 family endonuclease